MSTTAPADSILPLANVARFIDLLDRLRSRPAHLPGLGVFYGTAGLRKTMAAVYAKNAMGAIYVECDSTFTQKALCEAIMVELGLLKPRERLKREIYRAVREIGRELAETDSRTLIIDEADFLMKGRRIIEMVRAIYKHCADEGASIVLIGEERMPYAMAEFERIDSRVLKYVTAQRIDLADAKTLAGLISPGLDFKDSALAKLIEKSSGSARKAVGLLSDLNEQAAVNGWSLVGDREIEAVERLAA